jgi:uncharacterized protein (TIGR02145 family)
MNEFKGWYRFFQPIYIVIICIFFMLVVGCDKTDDVKNKAPICFITSPKNGDELLQGKTINLSVEATDEDGNITEVTISIDSIVVSTTHSFPYQYQWNTANTTAGNHTIKATAIDNSNNTASDKIALIIFEGGNDLLETGTVNDYDGNTYKTVKIGNQWWMAENLKTTHFSNGTEIPFIENNESWDNLQLSDKAYCYYNDSITHANTYGALYTWAAAMNGDGSSELIPSLVPGICPVGWHLPSDGEWIVLEMQLGMTYDEAWLLGWRGINEGTKMKAKEGWDNNGSGTNNSGFSALPAGIRSNQGLFSELGKATYYWSTTEYINNADYAFTRKLYYNQSGVGWFHANHYYGYPKDFGLSVRCVKD